ncbi:MAG TPA: hypothetical protein VGJ32_14590 [Solirubrobacteraceae bacterium]|jgi:hypothetical protein
MDVVRGAVLRVSRAWRALAPEQRLAAFAALALFGTMLLPWYQLQRVVKGRIDTHDVSAFGVFSFVEAAVLLVGLGVLLLLFLRGEDRGFHLPGGDGTVIFAAGLWAAFLLFFRVLDRPPGGGYPVGIAWGFFVAFVAAGFLAYAGARLRAAHRPEPPLPPESRAEPTVRRRPRDDETPAQLSFDEAETQRLRE